MIRQHIITSETTNIMTFQHRHRRHDDDHCAFKALGLEAHSSLNITLQVSFNGCPAFLFAATLYFIIIQTSTDLSILEHAASN